MMKKFKIALVPGDGVGQEVIEAAREVLEAVAPKGEVQFEFTEYMAGKIAYEKTTDSLPAETLDGIRRSDATLMGSMATGLVPPPSPMGRLRRELDLYADIRPSQSFPGVWCLQDNLDLIVVRENTQGFLADRNLYKGYGEFMPDEDTVLSLRVLTRKGCERIAKFAFDYATKLARKKITAVHKSNVLRTGDGFFLDICKEVAKKYPSIEFKDEYVDAVANNLIAFPENYDVLLTTNLYGDIISDEAAALVSSLVPTANFGEGCSLFRPIHEAMLSIAGKGIVNPISTILSSMMMLEYLGVPKAAARIKQAVKAVLAKREVLTQDLGGKSTTTEMTRSIVETLLKEW
jgi:isocitrate/isopropylmalate dehydrogenase